MAGGHLDSVPAGPGLNDNGSGVAALLHIAERLRRPATGRCGSGSGAPRRSASSARAATCAGSPRAERQRIAAYVNLDMVGTPDSEPEVYDGAAHDRGGAAPPPPPRHRRGASSRATPTTRRSSASASPSAASSPASTTATTSAATRCATSTSRCSRSRRDRRRRRRCWTSAADGPGVARVQQLASESGPIDSRARRRACARPRRGRPGARRRGRRRSASARWASRPGGRARRPGVGIVAVGVVDHEVVAIAGHDLEAAVGGARHAVLAVGAEADRLALHERDAVEDGAVLLGQREERAVVEDRAVLVDLDERGALVLARRRAARRSCGGGRGRPCGRRTSRPRRAPARAG